MKNKPLVSVLIPVYNSEKHLKETIQSVRNQSYDHIEIILVNDGSNDNSLEIAKEFESDRIQVISTDNNGASQARNIAFKASKGEFIQFLDADDLLSPNKIENQIKTYLNSTDENVLYSGTWGRFSASKEQVTWEHQEINKSYDLPHLWLVDSWKGKGMAQPGVWLTPRSVIERAGEWNTNISLNDDGEFFSRVILNSQKIVFVEDSLVYYRSGEQTSLSNTISSKALDSELESIKLYKEHFHAFGHFNEHRSVLVGKLFDYLVSFPSLSKDQVVRTIDLIKEWNTQNMKPILNNKLLKIFTAFLGFKNAILLRNKIKS